MFTIIHFRNKKYKKFLLTLTNIIRNGDFTHIHVKCYLSHFFPTTNEAKRRLSHRGGRFCILNEDAVFYKNFLVVLEIHSK